MPFSRKIPFFTRAAMAPSSNGGAVATPASAAPDRAPERTPEGDLWLGTATADHVVHAERICEMIAHAAAKRGTGIARRSPDYVAAKMTEGKAVVALDNGVPVGFCYIEAWSHGRFVANSGLIVAEEYRNSGLARRIKREVFALSRRTYPTAKIFSITTSLAVMKLNSDLGYRPVTFSELTDDEQFWDGCRSCPNVDILERNSRKMCLCTGMLYDPEREEKSLVQIAIAPAAAQAAVPVTPGIMARLRSTIMTRFRTPANDSPTNDNGRSA